MISRSWLNLYWRLAVATLIICAAFYSSISWLHGTTIALLGIVVPLALAWLGGRFTQEPEASHGEASTAIAAWPWFGVALFAIACLKFAVVGFSSSGFVPTLHDEWSYLFGAETIARGHLSNPTPRHAEFFDAFHILCTPRWVTRYPPGHPIALALGVLLSWPPAIVIAEVAGTVVWIYLLAREVAGESVARLAGALALIAPGMDYLAGSYLSQSTFLFAITGCYAATLVGTRRGSMLWLAIAGLAGGWAMLTRPYSAVALGSPLAAWFIRELFGNRSAGNEEAATDIARSETLIPIEDSGGATLSRHSIFRRSLLLLAATTPVGAALAFFAAYNCHITGSPWMSAWGEYNRQFEPDNTVGFSSGSSRATAPEMSARKAERSNGITREKMQFTWRAALRRTVSNPQRLSEMVFSAIGFYGLATFIPFGNCKSHSRSASTRSHWWLIALAPVAHYAAYACFYSTWGAYALETIPFIVLLVAIGVVKFWRCARECDRPGIAILLPLFLSVALVVDGREIDRLIGKRREETRYHRDFERKLSSIDKPSIVFVRLDPLRTHPYDLINNSPDLNAHVLVVLDLRERNAELLAQFPDRAAYVYHESMGQLIPWTSAGPALQARWPARPPLAFPIGLERPKAGPRSM